MKKIFTLALFTLLPVVALAAPSTYTLLAPLGPLGGPNVTLAQYLEGIVQVTIGVAGILAVVMTVICGIQLIGSPSVSQKSASKDCITSAIFGLLLAISSWLILNTINTQLLSSDVALLGLPAIATTPTATTTAANAPLPKKPGFYYRYKDSASGPILNSPQWGTIEQCIEGKKGQVALGGIIVYTPPSTTIDCFYVYPQPVGVPPPPPGNPPPGPSSGEAAVRNSICGNNLCQLGTIPVAIKQPPCPAGISNCLKAGYINVEGMPSSAIAAIKALPPPVVITGGTESGHATHKPNSPIFDLRKTPALDAYIRSSATQSAVSFYPCRYLLNNFWFTDEGNHWHVCEVGQPYWFCTGKNKAGVTLPPGAYSNCPLK